jgi:dienelactone hydrolase
MPQFWYPIQGNRSLTPAAWLPPNASRHVEDAIETPAILLGWIVTHVSYNGTAIFSLTERDTTPILVFSTGSWGLCAYHSTFLSALASFGYTIMAVDHPHDSSRLEKPDGNLALQANTTDDIEFVANVQQADVLWLASQISRESVCRWLPSSMACKNRLGSGVKLGIFGHSLGGDAASLAMQDKATLYKASASLDGAFFSPLNRTGF